MGTEMAMEIAMGTEMAMEIAMGTEMATAMEMAMGTEMENREKDTINPSVFKVNQTKTIVMWDTFFVFVILTF